MSTMKELKSFFDHLREVNVIYDKKRHYVILHKGPVINARASLEYYRMFFMQPPKEKKLHLMGIRTWIKLNLLYQRMFKETLTPKGFFSVTLQFRSKMREKQYIQTFHANYNEAMTAFDDRVEQATVDFIFHKVVYAEYCKTITSPLAYLYAHKRLCLLVVPKTNTDVVIHFQTPTTSTQYRLRLALFVDRCLYNVLQDFLTLARRDGRFVYPLVATTGLRVHKHHVQDIVQRSMTLQGRHITISEDVLYFVYLYALCTRLGGREFLRSVPRRECVSDMFRRHTNLFLSTLLKHFVFECIPLLFRTGTYRLTVQNVRSLCVYPRFM